MMKYLLVLTGIISLFAAAFFLFWHQDVKYSLPTPVPDDYVPVQPRHKPDLEDLLKGQDKPVLLHFFNPHCPCSRFNIKHFRSLVRQFDGQMYFYVILQDVDEESAREAFASYDLPVVAYYDSGGKIAARCGVYATPQAVVLDSAGKIFYKGNYNSSRYCTTPATDYARLSIEALFAGDTLAPVFGTAASTAYGCQLPTDNPETATPLFSLF